MSNALYINKNGFPVTRHSYSGGDEFGHCARKYELHRIVGWKEIMIRAAMPFGSCVEHGMRALHAKEEDAIKVFRDEWARVVTAPENKSMVYSEVERDAEEIEQIGIEMLKLYALKVKDFPYEETDIAFQVERQKEIFPGHDALSGITFIAYLDMVTKMKENGEKLIIDCKVSGAKIPDYLILDPQLQSYAWIENTPNVGFLWFQKITRALKKGSDVTFLSGPHAGKPGVILKVETDDFGSRVWAARNEALLDQMDTKFSSTKKEVQSAKDLWLEQNAIRTTQDALTKQKVSVRIGKIPLRLMQEKGKSIEQDVVGIHKAAQDDFFPQQGGVRWPNDKCLSCCMRGLCSGDNKVRDELVTLSTVDNMDKLLKSDND